MLELFWDLFRQGIITLGLNDSNREFPFFRLTQNGKRAATEGDAYFFHDVTSYERAIRCEVPDIDDATLKYLKEAMQAFRSGCLLTECAESAHQRLSKQKATHQTFHKLIEQIWFELLSSHGD